MTSTLYLGLEMGAISRVQQAKRCWVSVGNPRPNLLDCGIRLDTYGRRCKVRITPHQLRHSFGTLLLNAGAPIEALQQLMGHENIDTTLVYSRVYDSTVAADYYRAMGQIEGPQDQPVNGKELLELLDVLQSGDLDESQQQAMQALRIAIQSFNLALSSESESSSTGVRSNQQSPDDTTGRVLVPGRWLW